MSDWHEEVFREEGWFDVDEEPPLGPSLASVQALARVRAAMEEIAAQRGCGRENVQRCCGGSCGR